jgi:hypothetical protein
MSAAFTKENPLVDLRGPTRPGSKPLDMSGDVHRLSVVPGRVSSNAVSRAEPGVAAACPQEVHVIGLDVRDVRQQVEQITAQAFSARVARTATTRRTPPATR